MPPRTKVVLRRPADVATDVASDIQGVGAAVWSLGATVTSVLWSSDERYVSPGSRPLSSKEAEPPEHSKVAGGSVQCEARVHHREPATDPVADQHPTRASSMDRPWSIKE